MRTRIFIIILVIGSLNLWANENVIYQNKDSIIYEQYVKKLSNSRDKPINELIVETAFYFLDKPYVASTLETSESEELVINLREFDCTTFVENCIALARTIKSEDHSFENYCHNLQDIRYRNGIVDGYTSRLHYMADWIHENEKKGLLTNISLKLGGEKITKKLNYMTTHISSYKHLTNNSENIEKQKNIEYIINSRNSYSYIPKSNISDDNKQIDSGDVVIFATSLAGMDYSHMGIMYWLNGKLHFIHASSKQKKTVIEQKTLTEYCNASKSCTGVTIVRVNNN